MKLSESYRPQSLADVVGQPMPVAILSGWKVSPFACCWLFRGGPGVGKTSTAYAMAHDLGADESVQVVPCSDLGIERAREMVRSLSYRPIDGGKWSVLILEELERLSPACQQFLKVALESLPPHAVVMATSNDTDLIDGALIQRFTVLDFSSSDTFAREANKRLAEVWSAETGGDELPKDLTKWGFTGGRQFSLRLAYDKLQQQLMLRRAVLVTQGGAA